MKRDTARLLKFGDGRHTVYFSSAQGYSNCTQTGYETPESFVKPQHWWADPPDKLTTSFESFDVPAEGIPVLDLRQAVRTAGGRSWVFKGPMLNVDLPEGEVDALPQVSPMMATACAGNAYGSLLALHEVTKTLPQRGALDSVSVPEYVAGWKEHGARIGRFYCSNGKGEIVWNA